MNRDLATNFQTRDQFQQNRFSNHANPYSDAFNTELRPARVSSQENNPVDEKSRSSGIGIQPDHTRDEGSSDSRARILRGSLESSQGILRHNNQAQFEKKSSDDLTLEMLGPTNKLPASFTSYEPRSDGQRNQYSNYVPQVNSKGPPSSALDLHSGLLKDQSNSSHPHSSKNIDSNLTLEQYRQNNQNLQQILNQLDSTPQFNSSQVSQNAINRAKGSNFLNAQPLTSGQGSRHISQLSQIKEVSEIKPFSYNNDPSLGQRPTRIVNENPQNFGRLKDDFNKIDMLQQAIRDQAQGPMPIKRNELQQIGSQIVQNENKNKQNQRQQPIGSNQRVERTKSTPAPGQYELLNQHKQIMKHFDDIPISKIKTMVGYQTNPDMYDSEAKVKEVAVDLPVQPEPEILPRRASIDGGESDGEEDTGPIEERVAHALWKVRSRAFKEINQHFYNDYAKNQSDRSYPMTSFDQFGPLLQEMIKDQNLTNAFEALQCLHSYVRFASDIKAVTHATHNFLLEKVQTNKPNFRDITLKILIGMLRRDQGASCLYPELLKRFKSKNSKCAHFCMLVVIEAFRTKEQEVIQDMNLRQMFKSIQESITHHNKDLRESSYAILKNIFERCKDEPSAILANCKNLRPVQIKELTEELLKIEKVPGATQIILDQNDQWEENPVRETNQVKSQKTAEPINERLEEAQMMPVKPIEQEFFDLLALLPDDFSEIPYTQQINTKKKSMELFNIELSKVLEKGSAAVIKQKDYSIIFNTVLHMLEDKNMLVFLEAIKSLELLASLQQMKAGKAKTFIPALAGKYGETKTAVIASTDKAMAAIAQHSLSPQLFSDICVNQIVSTHKNPRVKQFIITNAITNMLRSFGEQENKEGIAVVLSVFKKIEKELIKLILKDTNNSVRDAVVQLVVDFGNALQTDQTAYQSVIAAIQVLPKYRIAEITGKLKGAQLEDPISTPQQQFSKTINPNKVEQTSVDEEFSKTLVPSTQLTDLKAPESEALLQTFKKLETSKQADAQALFLRLQAALQNETTYLAKNRELLINGLLQLCLSSTKTLSQPNIANILAAFFKDTLSIGTLKLSKLQIDQTIQVILLISSHQTDNELLNEVFQLLISAFGDVRDFCEALREVVEMKSILENYRAITIITNVYQWLGQMLGHFLNMGMDTVDLEELRGFGIKYLESTHLFGEQQRQQLIQVMIQFKEQVLEAKTAALQTLGQELVESSASSIPTTKMQTATWRPQTHEEDETDVITADIICKTIDSKFEQGLLMFKELAQTNQSLDFETKEQIFNKLISIVVESQRAGNQEQQQYRQAYALKALMWMKEETMGLEDTFKLTSKVMQVYIQQVLQENDASVEVYLLNFWVKDLSMRDLADRIQVSVNNFKGQDSRNSSRGQKSSNLSEQQLESFRIIFDWFDEQWLTPQADNWRLSDLRKIALLICESITNQRSKQGADRFKKFVGLCVERETRDKVLEFIEIQLMQSKDVFISFLDWFQSIYPSKNQVNQVQQPLVAKVELRPTSNLSQPDQQITPRGQIDQQSSQSMSYLERRQQMKAQNVRKDEIESSQNQIREIIQKIERTKTPVLQPTEELPVLRQTHTSNFNKSQKSRYDPDQSSGEKEDYQMQNEQTADHYTNDRDIYERVQQSEVKQQAWMSKIVELEAEKSRIESETALLKQQKNQESQAWQSKLQQMQSEHQNVVASLTEVNKSYVQQVEENETLKQQLASMQKQHNDMMVRFEQIERKINSREAERTVPATPQRSQQVNLASREHLTMSVAKLQRISDTFSLVDQKIGVQKIQELLLTVERNVDGELAQPLISHYVKMRSTEERLSMIHAVTQALTINEDVLLALSVDVYKALLNFLLRAFAHEKERLDSESIGGHQKTEQNEVTMKSQQLVSRLLNSKEFTTSLVSLFQLLREAMPTDLTQHLPLEETQYLRVLMRCVMRITKALHSEASDLVRGFDVLIEMQKIFLRCPPENLREDLPCLADFDFVFRGMKDVSDRLVELQPEKVQSFLSYNENSPENAFIKYLRQVSA